MSILYKIILNFWYIFDISKSVVASKCIKFQEKVLQQNKTFIILLFLSLATNPCTCLLSILENDLSLMIFTKGSSYFVVRLQSWPT